MKIRLLLVVLMWFCLPGVTLAQAQTRPRVVKPTVIAVLDSGVDVNNAALMSRVWTNPNEIPGNDIDDDKNGCIDDERGCNVFNISGDIDDRRGHGTYVISVPALLSNLTSPFQEKLSSRVKIFPLRTMVESTSYAVVGGKAVEITDILDARGTVETMVKAIDVVIATKKAAGGNFIINASWEFRRLPEDTLLIEEAFKRAEEAGMLVVVSAGNMGESHELSYPASLRLPNMIAVGATAGKQFANYSNKGADIAADGTNLPSLGPGYLRYLRGTSFSAPTVATVAAEIWDRHPEFTALEVKAVILETADVVEFLKDKVEGNRLLNIEKAIAK